MASTMFVTGIPDEELLPTVWGLVRGDGDELVEGDVTRWEGTDSPISVSVMYRTRLDGEDEDSFLTDTYDVDDYDIEAYDWAGGNAILRITLGWRRHMLARFGQGYAERYLVGILEDALAEGGED